MITKKTKLLTLYMFLILTMILCVLYFFDKISFNPWFPTAVSITLVIYGTIDYYKTK